MSYYPDLKLLALDEYRDYLLHKTLLPGRVGLRDNIDKHFAAIRQAGITDMADLSKALSTSQKLAGFSSQTGIPEPYLVLLKREIGSLLPKALPIKEIADLDENTHKVLEDKDIKTTKDYYEVFLSGNLNGVSLQTARDLFSQCDLVRINGMGLLAAKLWIAAGYDSVEAIASAEAETMLEHIHKANADNAFYTGELGLKDMQFCIDNAKFLLKYTAQ